MIQCFIRKRLIKSQQWKYNKHQRCTNKKGTNESLTEALTSVSHDKKNKLITLSPDYI